MKRKDNNEQPKHFLFVEELYDVPKLKGFMFFLVMEGVRKC